MLPQQEDAAVKRCAKCHTTKPLADFNRGRKSRDGRNSYCRECQRAIDQERCTPTWHSWHMMLQRCGNPNCVKYPSYAGRGIKVCERWGTSFANFVADLGERPPGHTLDRINNDGPYAPSNCRWATPKEQRVNQRPRRTASPAWSIGPVAGSA